MNLIFSLTLIWAVYSTAGALQCITCTDQSCSNTTSLPCSSETMCITATFLGTQDGVSGTEIFKSCASSLFCPATGNATFSVNLGSLGAIASAQCCNTDNCNSQTLLSPATPTPNTLQCIACDPKTSQCATTITCSGEENNCITAAITNGNTTIPVLGCASPNTCAVASNLGGLPFMENIGSVTSGPTCCSTSLCNDPRTTTTTTTTTPNSTTTTTTPTPTTPTTTTTTPTSTTNDASCFRLDLLHLLLGFFIFVI